MLVKSLFSLLAVDAAIFAPVNAIVTQSQTTLTADECWHTASDIAFNDQYNNIRVAAHADKALGLFKPFRASRYDVSLYTGVPAGCQGHPIASEHGYKHGYTRRTKRQIKSLYKSFQLEVSEPIVELPVPTFEVARKRELSDRQAALAEHSDQW